MCSLLGSSGDKVHTSLGGTPRPLPHQHQNDSFRFCHLFGSSVLLLQDTLAAELSAPLWHLVAHMDPVSRGPNDLSWVPTVFSPVPVRGSLANAPRTLGESGIVVNALLSGADGAPGSGTVHC